MSSTRTTRRDFFQRSILTGAGLVAGLRAVPFSALAQENPYTSRVAITKGADRADNAFRALQMFKKEIAAAIGDKRVVIKPNFVWFPPALCCTHAAFVEGILEFLKSIGKRDVVIAESSATNNTMAGFDYNGYWPLTTTYPVKLMDLNQEGFSSARIWSNGDHNDSSQGTIRVSKMLSNPHNFIISAAPMKTHNTVLVTLATKNVAMAAPVYDVGAGWSQAGARGDKATMHGPAGAPSDGNKASADYQVLNDNVFRLVKVYGIHPHLAVIDGYQGMEHNGPVSGTAIATGQQLAVASLDWLAADRVALELMGSNVFVKLNQTADGYDMPFPACLNYLGQQGFGEWDLRKIQIVGEPIAANVYNYAAHDYQTAGYETLNIRTVPRE
jgi:uncharacterized protein (DUF362 family)